MLVPTDVAFRPRIEQLTIAAQEDIVQNLEDFGPKLGHQKANMFSEQPHVDLCFGEGWFSSENENIVRSVILLC